MANECMWCADGKLVEVDHGKWRCDKCHAMHDQAVDKGGPGDQEKVRYEPTPGQQEPSYIGLRGERVLVATAGDAIQALKDIAWGVKTSEDFEIVEDFKPDAVNHPSHYTQHPSGVECIQITEHMSFTMGNAMKYLWRADLKNGVEDLKKAIWYIQREIAKRGKA